MNIFARFDENPAMTLRVIKETKRYRRTDAFTDGQRENSIPPTNKVCGGYKNAGIKRHARKKLFSYLSTKTYDMGTQKNHLTEMVILHTRNI